MRFVRYLLIALATNILVLFVASWIIGPMTYGDSWWTLVIAGAVFGIVNTILRPIIVLLSLPAVILTLGIALFFINMFMLWLTSLIVDDLAVGDFSDYVWATLVILVVNLLVDFLLRPKRKGPRAADVPA
jgi:putative membrane protein